MGDQTGFSESEIIGQLNLSNYLGDFSSFFLHLCFVHSLLYSVDSRICRPQCLDTLGILRAILINGELFILINHIR